MIPTFSMNENRRWLLVDDNAETLRALHAVATNFTDATVECHNSPHSALMAFAAAPGAYDLVITDFEMPGMDGVELCRHLQEIFGGQKVFLSTGSGFFTEAAARLAGFSALLNKPFPLALLRHALAANGLAANGLAQETAAAV